MGFEYESGGRVPCAPVGGAEEGMGAEISEPGTTVGAHETALQPMPCPLKMSAPHVPSSSTILASVNHTYQ